jgi:hypothetical protein
MGIFQILHGSNSKAREEFSWREWSFLTLTAR